MTKKWTWLILVIAVVALWYWWKSGIPAINLPSGNQTTNNEISGPAGALPVSTGQFSSEIAGIIREATEEQSVTGMEAGETALVTSVGQQVSDLNQAYDENQF